MRNVRLNDNAHDAIRTLPLWINKCRFVAKVIFDNDKETVKIAETTATRHPRSSVTVRSELVIKAVEKVRALHLA